MAKFKIRIYGDEVLRKKTKFVKTFDKKLQQLIDDMFKAMHESGGIGLAAPQVGILKKIIVVDTGEEGECHAFVNPKIVWRSDEECLMKEGCLSIPGVEGEVVRSDRIKVKADDPATGEEFTFEADGLLARVIQHEMDHLNGVLFVDLLQDAERSLLDRKLQELAAA